jgi:hypothetical protein
LHDQGVLSMHECAFDLGRFGCAESVERHMLSPRATQR